VAEQRGEDRGADGDDHHFKKGGRARVPAPPLSFGGCWGWWGLGWGWGLAACRVGGLSAAFVLCTTHGHTSLYTQQLDKEFDMIDFGRPASRRDLLVGQLLRAALGSIGRLGIDRRVRTVQYMLF